ncbi:GTP-binding protein [Amycolatopsis sp. NPDC049688]|uniref:GTP-binding protein n=1 Tax=Amycolatopsis sp. NPDC049688 TaxID=3154733 RepID=UPI00341F2D19
MPTLNLGILAHVDAGKTTLTERLLLAAGVIDRLGRVDDGTTQTDTLALERARGITIKSAVVSFAIGATTVNLIDTPGHPDFIAEVERVLSVLDGAVLVVSAVEGVQAQTRVLARALDRLGIPAVVFVNKTDRRGADPGRVRAEIARKLPPAPVFEGSALTGDGVDELRAAVVDLLPKSEEDSGGPLSGTVFKVDKRKAVLVRVFSGTLRVRQKLPAGKVTAIHVFEQGKAVRRDRVTAGRIARVTGLDARIGDAIGEPPASAGRQFAPPTLRTVVTTGGDKGALHAALAQLAEQDPLIGLQVDGSEILLSLYGEVQKEVIQATLADEYGVDVEFGETTTIHVQRVTGTGESVRLIGEDADPFLATVGLRVEPADSGVTFGLAVEPGSMPAAFFRAVEETVRATLASWSIPACAVTMTHSGYYARQSHSHGTFDKSMSSTAGDFRDLTPIVLREALDRAGTVECEPIHRFTLDVPADTISAVTQAVARVRGIPKQTNLDGPEARIEGDLPAAEVHGLQRRLPGLTRGEGVLETVFDRYEPRT